MGFNYTFVTNFNQSITNQVSGAMLDTLIQSFADFLRVNRTLITLCKTDVPTKPEIFSNFFAEIR